MRTARFYPVAIGLTLLAIAGCGRTTDPAALPPASRTLTDVGKRLGRRLAPDALTKIGGSEPRLLSYLHADERLSLGRAYLRFRIDRPAIVDIAVSDERPPFWLTDSGFEPTGVTADHPDGPFRLWSRRFPAGTVGLGVNALDRTPRGHYAVFVRGVDSPPVVDRLDPPDFRVVPAGANVGPYSDDARPFASVPDALASAQIIQSRRDRRHASALIRSKVWKTRVPSSEKPDQIVVSLGDDPARGLAWTWRTDTTVPPMSLDVEAVDGSWSSVVPADHVDVDSNGLLNDPTIRRHRARLSGLRPDTAYRYAIRGGRPDDATRWQTVRTAPIDERDYAFLYMGDPQCGLEEWGTLLHKARERRPDAGFLLIAGDLVDRGNERSNWDHFFQRAAGVFENLAVMPAVGNHEYLDRGPAIFSASFALPGNGPPDAINRLVYSFVYSDVFVAVLDSNPAVYSPAQARVQADWLDAELARTPARWKVVVFHHPVYASHPTREQPGLGESWVPTFDRHGVDLVLQGHDHAYLRTYPMRGGERHAEGTIYVVSVSGQKFVAQADRPWTARGFTDVATYQTIDISPRNATLMYRAYDLAGSELDRVELRKPRRSEVASRPSAARR